METRKGFYCSLCKFEIGKSVSLANSWVFYHPQMCMEILNNYFLFIKAKTYSIYQIMLLYDELFFTIFHKELIKNNFDWQIIHKFLLESQKCEKEGFIPNAKNQKIKKNCQKLCKNYHLNNFTLLFDGDYNLINDFINNLGTLV